MSLPKSLNIDHLKNLEIPGDLTLAEVRATIVEQLSGLNLQPGKQLRLRFVITSTNPESEAPETMTVKAFRTMVKYGNAHLSIDDQGGGLPVTPELVPA